MGVSYFGRPIREGETEENISEADATDFDDDLELAKTVGTPAFFAPELCYTDMDIDQPKVTEQIDVWSLGITLYCLVFARIPFMAEDEYRLFRAIAKEDVYIPKKRLKAVDPANSTSHANLTRRAGPSTGPYREDGELAYEDIDDELYDLLRRMLIKDPVERMKLREVKRHPWTIRGMDNIIGWLDDSDPSRRTAGRRIQVDDQELDHAVVPITFLERARSTFKKIGKAIGVTRGERSGESSRRRAVSSATSSAPDSAAHTPVTSAMRDNRRASLREDDSYFAAVSSLPEQREPYEHPLAQSHSASPEQSTDCNDPFARNFAQNSSSVGATPTPVDPGTSSELGTRPGPPDRTVSAAASIQTVVHRDHSLGRSVTAPTEDRPKTPGPFTDHHGNVFGGHLWNGRGRDTLAEVDESDASRAGSVDRSLFESENKHAAPSVATTTAIAPGHFEHTTTLWHPRPSRSAGHSPTNPNDKPLASPPLLPAKHPACTSSLSIVVKFEHDAQRCFQP